MNEELKRYVMSRKQNPIGEYSLGDIKIYIKEELPPEIDLYRVLDFIEKNLPPEFYSNVDMIYIGRFPFLNSRQANAVFKDGAIYLSNQQTSEHNLLSDLIHEIGHSFEETNAPNIYGDGKIEQEFLAKRDSLLQILTTRKVDVGNHDFSNPEFDVGFDRLLYNDIGYSTLTPLTSGLFISPYGATSLREYFANSFEEFFVNDVASVKKLAPSVYEKLIEFLEFE